MDRLPPLHGNHPNPHSPTPLRRKRTWFILALTAAVVLTTASAACYRPRARQNVPDPGTATAEFAVGDCIRSDGATAEKIDCDDATPGEDYRITEDANDGQECADAGLDTLTATKTNQIFCLEQV